jgi:LysM repeat protein
MGYEEKPEEAPRISTLRYSSLKENKRNAKLQPLNLAGLTRASKKMNLEKISKKAKILLERLFEQLSKALSSLPPLPPSPGAYQEEESEKENLSPFHYSIPLDQEWISRPSLSERRKARRQARFRRMAALLAIVIAVFFVAGIRRIKPLSFPILPVKTANQPKIASPSPSPLLHYTVRKGDYWGAIAGHFGISSEKLATNNGKSTEDILRPGDVLVVPKGKGLVHVVQKGDNVSTLLVRYGTSFEDFKKANSLVRIRELKVGQRLYFNPR